MEGDERVRSPGARRALAVARGAVLAAAALLVAWLFLVYEPPHAKRYPDREKVVFWHMWTAKWEKVVQEIVDRFNASQTQWEVVALVVPGGSLKTLIATAGGDPPDVMAQWDPVIPAWAERGALTPLDEILDPKDWAYLEKNMYPAVRAIGTYKGHFYGLSTGMNIWAIYYRPSRFREAGLDPDRFPETLEELDAAAAKLFRYDAAGRITRIGFMPRWLSQWSAVFGGSFYDATRGELTLLDPGALRALEWMTDYTKRYGFERVQQFESGLTTSMGASWPFISGAYAITVDGQWRIQDLAEAKESDYRTAPIPPPEGGKPLACWSNGNFMVVPSGAKHKQGALAFMKFWSGVDDPERAAEFYTWGGWLPITPDVANARRYQQYIRENPEFATFVRVLASPNVQVSPPVPIQAYLMNRLGSAEDAALRGTLTPRQAMERLDEEIRREQRLQNAAATQADR